MPSCFGPIHDSDVGHGSVLLPVFVLVQAVNGGQQVGYVLETVAFFHGFHSKPEIRWFVAHNRSAQFFIGSR